VPIGYLPGYGEGRLLRRGSDNPDGLGTYKTRPDKLLSLRVGQVVGCAWGVTMRDREPTIRSRELGEGLHRGDAAG